jgi:hypothetical protein
MDLNERIWISKMAGNVLDLLMPNRGLGSRFFRSGSAILLSTASFQFSGVESSFVDLPCTRGVFPIKMALF